MMPFLTYEFAFVIIVLYTFPIWMQYNLFAQGVKAGGEIFSKLNHRQLIHKAIKNKNPGSSERLALIQFN